ncbi:MAG: YitT family protein [Blautia sp.]|nr:YitT family protein [Eubacteriales bacterium]MED9966096.1 YitT family protein [Blautia sp.]
MKTCFSFDNVKKFSIQILWELLGSVFIAIGIYNFAVQAKFPMTGFSGISIILYRLWNIPIGLSTILLNIPVAILCYRLLGRKFFISSIRCMVLSSVLIDYVAPLFPVYEGNRLLAALCTGVFGGIGYALIYSKNSSTGGSDFVIMAVKAIKPHLSLGKIAFWSDVGIILVGGILFRDVDGVIYGMVVNYIFAVAVDKLMYGINSGKLALVVTEHGSEICQVIDNCCQRGSTILSAYGGYCGEKKQVVMCACSNKEMFQVQQAVKAADPQSFLIILESNEVHGEGFHMVQIGEPSNT